MNPQPVTSNWIVENFQIPVPIGDCSVHVLLQHEPMVEGSIYGTYTLHHAFIMDGGDSDGAAVAITQAMEWIQFYLKKEYNIDHVLKFNSWVVTHWDADHYVGVMNLVRTKGWLEKHFYLTNKKAKCYSGRATGRKDAKPIKAATDLGFVVEGGESLIGLDLLSGDYITDKQGILKRPDPLVSYDTIDPGRPRFVVVGANGHGIACDKAMRSPSRNETSILAVLYWPDYNGHCSYFTGGDGNPKMELLAVIPYLREPPTTHWQVGKMFLPEEKVLDLMKLDHHGSSGEGLWEATLSADKRKRGALDRTPMSLFRPWNILVTPGNEHGHPTYDVVHFVMDLLERVTGVNENGKTNGTLFTTRSPYWASKEFPTMKDLNAKHQSALLELHEKNMELWDDPAQKDVTVAMLMAQHAIEHEVTARRYLGLKTWYKRILAQEVILMGKKATQYHIDKLAQNYNAALRASLQPTVDTPEGQASVLFDYETQVQTDITSLRMSGREMWAVVCDQGIVTENQDPFFIVHFCFKNAKLEPIRCLDWDGNEKFVQPESPPPQVSARIALERQLLEKVFNFVNIPIEEHFPPDEVQFTYDKESMLEEEDLSLYKAMSEDSDSAYEEDFIDEEDEDDDADYSPVTATRDAMVEEFQDDEYLHEPQLIITDRDVSFSVAPWDTKDENSLENHTLYSDVTFTEGTTVNKTLSNTVGIELLPPHPENSALPYAVGPSEAFFHIGADHITLTEENLQTTFDLYEVKDDMPLEVDIEAEEVKLIDNTLTALDETRDAWLRAFIATLPADDPRKEPPPANAPAPETLGLAEGRALEVAAKVKPQLFRHVGVQLQLGAGEQQADFASAVYLALVCEPSKEEAAAKKARKAAATGGAGGTQGGRARLTAAERAYKQEVAALTKKHAQQARELKREEKKREQVQRMMIAAQKKQAKATKAKEKQHEKIEKAMAKFRLTLKPSAHTTHEQDELVSLLDSDRKESAAAKAKVAEIKAKRKEKTAKLKEGLERIGMKEGVRRDGEIVAEDEEAKKKKLKSTSG